jgi:ABC-type antimicrobial peptide transport system permease subunit
LNDLSFALRTSGDELALAPTARRVMRSLDPEVPIDDVRAMTAVVADTVAPRRFEAAVLFAFGVVAMLLAGIGVYGVLSQSVIARTKELGVRLALGATPSTIRRFVLGEAMRLITLGLIVGVPAAVATGVSIRGLLFGIEPENPVVLAAACGIIILAALVAASIPAGRAAAVDPILSLRSE